MEWYLVKHSDTVPLIYHSLLKVTKDDLYAAYQLSDWYQWQNSQHQLLGDYDTG